MKGYYSDDYRRTDCRCGCGCDRPKERCEVQNVPGMAFIYFQPDINSCDVYDCAEAISRGTLFPGLDKPYSGIARGGSCKC